MKKKGGKTGNRDSDWPGVSFHVTMGDGSTAEKRQVRRGRKD